MQYSVKHITTILNASLIQGVASELISDLVTDSRRVVFPAASLFFALRTGRRDGHNYVKELYERGVKNFVVLHRFNNADFPLANFILVNDTLAALQQLSAYHRSQFKYPVIGITGSNGKTIVKEWLYQLLSPDYNIIRSPRSYNSQTGVPLSVWQMNDSYNLAIFEAGISKANEMYRLESIIKPGIGVFTNIGEAHKEGFANVEEKVREKFVLFKEANLLICNTDDNVIDKELKSFAGNIFSWGINQEACIQVRSINKENDETSMSIAFADENAEIKIPFTDDASIHNAITCICVMLQLQISFEIIIQRMQLLQNVNMRMQLLPGINNSSVIDDSYSFDVNSLSIALDFLAQQHQHVQKTVIISDLPGLQDKAVYEEVANMLTARKINRIITIGKNWILHKDVFAEKDFTGEHHYSTDSFISDFSANHFRNEAILLKGARVFKFEKISLLLQQKVHQTSMEINLTALVHNLRQYQQMLNPAVKLMAMVKAFGYGSGAGIANVLQFHKVDYLAVAYTDEGVELRRAGISLPILVLNIDKAAFENIVQFNLEPEIFSFKLLHAFDRFLETQGLVQYPVHIKFDTGMHRLGFEEPDLNHLISFFQTNHRIVIKSVFSHLAASGNPDEYEFTTMQLNKLTVWSNRLSQHLPYKFMSHIANSAAIAANSDLQLDMVRIGIGLYGVKSVGSKALDLQNVVTLKTTIAQLRKVSAGETVGYEREGKIKRDSIIATLRIGYADGLRRQLSNGIGSVYIKGNLAPVVGNIAMDMTIVDVTHINDVKEDDEAEIFGRHISVSAVAKLCNTIPYEILTGISQRVKRIYVEE